MVRPGSTRWGVAMGLAQIFRVANRCAGVRHLGTAHVEITCEPTQHTATLHAQLCEVCLVVGYPRTAAGAAHSLSGAGDARCEIASPFSDHHIRGVATTNRGQ